METTNTITTDADSLEGTLCLDAGSGWMSRFEAGNLKCGDMVVSTHLAGQPFVLSFNGRFMAQAQLVVLDFQPAICAARIKSLNDPGMVAPAPDRGLELLELLPFEIRIARACYSLSSFDGAGVATLVHMDTAYHDEGNAELVVAGMVVATGTLMVRDENWALRIDTLRTPMRGGSEIRTTAAHVPFGPDAGKAKVYDARRPDWVTKPMLELLRNVHAEFLRSLQVVYHEAKNIRLESVDQLAFDEWVCSKPAKDTLVRVLSMTPTGKHPGTIVPDLPHKLCINPASSRLPLLHAGFEEEYKTWWQNNPAHIDTSRCLLSVPDCLAAMLPTEEDSVQLGACLRNGWKRALDARFVWQEDIGKGWLPEDMHDLVEPWAMILIAVFSVEAGQGRDYFECIYPLSTLQTHCPQFRT